MSDEHDFMTCDGKDCPECEEARSQSTCEECGGTVISAEGDWHHEPGCSQDKQVFRHSDLGSECTGTMTFNKYWGHGGYNDGLLLIYCMKCDVIYHFKRDRDWL